MPCVVDTSVVMKWVIREQATDNALALRDDYLRRNDCLYAPPLLIYEAANVLYALVRERTFTLQEAEQALADIRSVITLTHASIGLVLTAFRLTNAIGTQSTFDMQFFALAASLNCTLWTDDRRFARAVDKRLYSNGGSPIQMIDTFPVR